MSQSSINNSNESDTSNNEVIDDNISNDSSPLVAETATAVPVELSFGNNVTEVIDDNISNDSSPLVAETATAVPVELSFGNNVTEAYTENNDDKNNQIDNISDEGQLMSEKMEERGDDNNSKIEIKSGRNDRKEEYRGGFSTSICDFFSNSSKRSDFCALACCGLLLSDRNEYYLTKKSTWPWWFRIFVSTGIPLVFFIIMDILSAVFAEDDEAKDNWGFWTMVGLIIISSVLLTCFRCSRARMRRTIMERMYREKYEVDTHHESLQSYLENNSLDTWFAHSMIGWYPDDTIRDHDDQDDGGNDGCDQEQRNKGDLCTVIWNCFRGTCCGWACSTWFMCCGMCALGQEDRELQRMLPNHELLIDYITFEPFMNYYHKIIHLRRNQIRGFCSHCRALSQLSYRLLLMLLIILSLLIVLAFLRVEESFHMDNFYVVIATFLQSFLLLHFVHWRYHRFHVSFDAIVKLFSCGFTICCVMSMVYEMIISTIIEGSLGIGVTIGLKLNNQNIDSVSEDALEDQKNILYEKYFGFFSCLFFTLVFLNAFLIAATCEEMMKYFCFWIVEHPDFTSSEDLIEQAQHLNRNKIENKDKANNSEQEEEKPSSSSEGLVASDGILDGDKIIQIPHKSYAEKGAQITVAMIATAVGFTCCENFIYIFTRSEDNVSAQWETLIARSFFPVHALCAAIQSINVVKRDVEGTPNIGLGKILLPAVLLHGFFDFVLMLPEWFDFVLKHDPDNNLIHPNIPVNASNDYEDMPEDLDIADFLASLAPIFVMIGIIYYDCTAEAQHMRLVQMDIDLQPKKEANNSNKNGNTKSGKVKPQIMMV